VAGPLARWAASAADSSARVAATRPKVAVTPTLVVDGRFLTSGRHVPGGDVRDIVPILEDVIRLARQRRSGR